MTFTLDKTTEPSGGRFTGTFTVTNNTDERIAYVTDPCSTWLGLYRGGELMGGRRTFPCGQGFGRDYLEVGDTLEIAVAADTLEPGHDDAPPLEPGPYDAGGHFNGWSPTPIRVIIEPQVQG